MSHPPKTSRPERSPVAASIGSDSPAYQKKGALCDRPLTRRLRRGRHLLELVEPEAEFRGRAVAAHRQFPGPGVQDLGVGGRNIRVIILFPPELFLSFRLLGFLLSIKNAALDRLFLECHSMAGHLGRTSLG